MPVILKKKFQHAVTNVDAEISDRLRCGEVRSFIYVVPTKRRLRDVQREFLREVPAGVAPSFFLFTLETLAAQLFELTCRPRRILTGPAQAVLVNEAIYSVRDSLRYFRLRGNPNRLPKGTSLKVVE